MIIDYHYWECDCECYQTKQTEKEAPKSHFQKQNKASSVGNAAAPQNKANLSLVASSVKLSLSKLFLFPTSRKQSNSLQIDLFSKLASNSKLTSDKCKKWLENNLYLYCDAKDYKLDSCSKKQTTVTSKGHDASAIADPLVAASEKPLEK